jgi:spermidine/putrescine transport system substrate-binding protein
MKKSLLVVLLGLLIVSFTANAGLFGKKDKKVLYVFNWSDYMPDEVIAQFEEETGIKVIVDLYSSNEEMYAKIKAGGAGYDIAFPSADYQEIMIKQDMLAKIDKTQIPNIKNLDKDMIAKLDFDKNLDYVVPYAMGAVGIAVNKKYIKNYDHTYSIFERKDLKGHMTLLDDMRQVVTSALVYNGKSPVSNNPEDLEIAKQTILKWKENILKFDAESFGVGFANEEFWAVQGYFENISAQITDEQRKDLDFFIPEKGATMYIDSMVVLKDAKNKENAYKFINFIHRPDVYVKIIDFFSIPSINVEAEKLRTTTPPYSLDDMKRTVLIKDLGDALELHNKIWNEVLATE